MPRSFASEPDIARPMLVHLGLLGRLHVLLGAFAALCGMGLAVLSAGTRAGAGDLGLEHDASSPGVWILGVCGGLLIVGGVALVMAGRALDRRSAGGRLAALLLAVPNLAMVPFGTALSVYAFWVLLNDEARQEFGRPPREPGFAGDPS
jgi:hypothetical protein